MEQASPRDETQVLHEHSPAIVDDVYIHDPGRILLDTPIGHIQAWGAPSTDVSVSVSFYAGMKHAEAEGAYISQNLNLSAADARKLAAVLLTAAAHADKVCTDEPEGAAA